MYRGGQLRDISEDSEVSVTIIQQFRHLGPFTHPLSSSPSVDHASTKPIISFLLKERKEKLIVFAAGEIYP